MADIKEDIVPMCWRHHNAPVNSLDRTATGSTRPSWARIRFLLTYVTGEHRQKLRAQLIDLMVRIKARRSSNSTAQRWRVRCAS
jgi:hypothetical protein